MPLLQTHWCLFNTTIIVETGFTTLPERVPVSHVSADQQLAASLHFASQHRTLDQPVRNFAVHLMQIIISGGPY